MSTSFVIGLLAAAVFAGALFLAIRLWRRTRHGIEYAEFRRGQEMPRATHTALEHAHLELSKRIRSGARFDPDDFMTALETQLGVNLTPSELESFRRVVRDLAHRLSEDRPRASVHFPSLEVNMEGARPREKVQFRAVWNPRVRRQEWSTLHVYVFAGLRGFSAAYRDFERRAILPLADYESQGASAKIPRGSEITVVPHVENVTFNPPNASLSWLEDSQAVEFRMRVALTDSTDHEGRVMFFVGPLLVAEIPMSVTLVERSESPEPANAQMEDRVARPYRKIFVSYSHQDTPVVEALERAYTALGDSYLRDVKVLRSGEEWNETILAHIPTADVFQLCWSKAARESVYVAQEWRYAAELRRPYFIRPVYWERPLPPPPPELSQLHFTFVPLRPIGDVVAESGGA